MYSFLLNITLKKLFRYYKQEQLCIYIRYVIDLNIMERFIEFVNVSSGQDANYAVVEILIRYN